VRDGDGHGGGAAEAKGFDVRGSDQDVYPPMSDFLAPKGSDVQRVSSRAHHGRSGSRRRRQRDFTRQSGAGRSPRSEDPLLLAAGGDREHFLWGARSIVIAGTHGKTTTTSLAGGC
jgi:UDP-N-acetylmuramate: L-alanyl-gamma-D-glutamyl-meso-diaminopimelate ligase